MPKNVPNAIYVMVEDTKWGHYSGRATVRMRPMLATLPRTLRAGLLPAVPFSLTLLAKKHTKVRQDENQHFVGKISGEGGRGLVGF